MAETINALYRAKVIHRRGPWRSFEAVKYATLEPIGNVPPAEAEERYCAVLDDTLVAA